MHQHLTSACDLRCLITRGYFFRCDVAALKHEMQTGTVKRSPPDGHGHTKLRSQPSDSRDNSVMVSPIVNIADGDEVEVLGLQGNFYKVFVWGLEFEI